MSRKILVVEDNAPWFEGFRRLLISVGETREVINCSTVVNFIKKFPNSRSFLEIDICVTDLELGIVTKGSDKDPSDIKGLDKILPHVRLIAPWLPVICISRFLGTSGAATAKLSCSDFDAFFPKSYIGSAPTEELGFDGTDELTLIPAHTFHENSWEEIETKSWLNRVSRSIGVKLNELTSLYQKRDELEVLTDGEVNTQMEYFSYSKRNLEAVISCFNFGCQRIGVSCFQHGMSGLFIATIEARDMRPNSPVEAKWLLKWGNKTDKLQKETEAHKLIFKRGISRRIQTPLLFPNPIYYKGIGFIAYYFEDKTQTALDYIKEYGLEAFTPLYKKIVNGLYRIEFDAVSDLKELLSTFCLSNVESYATLFECEVSHVKKLKMSNIHGDFHLRNILVGEEQEVTLIDFANSQPGPVVVDIAKFIVDFVAFCKIKPPKSFIWEDFEANNGQELLRVLDESLNLNEIDKKFFSIAALAFCQRYQEYDDVSDEKKDLLMNLIKSTNAKIDAEFLVK
jgi:hypothetical protein